MSIDPRHASGEREIFLDLISRRRLFSRLGWGAGALALASLLAEDANAGEGIRATLDPRPAHKPARARRVLYLFQNGGQSQVDLYDPKPELQRQAGQKPGAGYVNDVDAKKTGVWLPSPFKFQRFGQCGMELSDLMPGLGSHADRIALVRSMVSEHENHEQACGHMHTGSPIAGRPTMGAWVSYGLGSINRDLPAFVAILSAGGMPVDGTRNWSSGWMPPVYQGMPVRAVETEPILDLKPDGPADAGTARLGYLQSLNRHHQRTRSDNLELDARIQAFELAARMQLAATDALDLGKESEASRRLYGLDRPETAAYGRQLLMARRLLERDVRFVQVMMAGQPWDTHTNNNNQIRSLCSATDRPVAGLLTDLAQRGLLEDTLVLWTGEFGRTPFAEGADGRDHHKRAFSLWMAGGGVRGGVTYGGTDEFGFASVVDPVRVADLHGTLLHLLGLDYSRLTFHHPPREEKLTDVTEARILEPILA